MVHDKKDKLVTGKSFGIKLLKSMGIDSHRVISFTLDCDPESGVTIYVKQFVTMTGEDGLLKGMDGCVVTERFDVNKQES